MPRRICIISPAAYPLIAGNSLSKSAGGAEAQLRTLGIEFAKQGYDVHFIVDDFGQPTSEAIGSLQVHKVALKYHGGPNYYLIPSWINLLRTLNRISADIHLIKVPRDIFLPVGLFCKIRRKKFVFIGQIDNDVDPVFLKKNNNFFAYWFFKIGMLGVDYAIAQNKRQWQGLTAGYGKKASIIKNILTLPDATPDKKEDYVLWVGNSLPKKQPELFVKLAKALPQFKFKMIMSLTPQVPDDSFVRNMLGSTPNLEYLGFVPFSEIHTYYNKARIFVSTSTSEGFPNTFLQAWQYKTPVVSLNIDPDEVINEYRLGVLSGSFDRLCSDVKDLMNDEKKQELLGQNAALYVKKNHTREVVIKKYVEVFNNLLQ